jgi:hypothetical protein
MLGKYYYDSTLCEICGMDQSECECNVNEGDREKSLSPMKEAT